HGWQVALLPEWWALGEDTDLGRGAATRYSGERRRGVRIRRWPLAVLLRWPPGRNPSNSGLWPCRPGDRPTEVPRSGRGRLGGGRQAHLLWDRAREPTGPHRPRGDRIWKAGRDLSLSSGCEPLFRPSNNSGGFSRRTHRLLPIPQARRGRHRDGGTVPLNGRR